MSVAIPSETTTSGRFVKRQGRMIVACARCGSEMRAEVGREIQGETAIGSAPILQLGWLMWWRCGEDHLTQAIPVPDKMVNAIRSS